MLTEPSKVFLRLSPVAILLSIVYGAMGRDRVGVGLLLLVGIVALVAGLLVLWSRGPLEEPVANQADEADEIVEAEVAAVAGARVGPPALAALGATLGALAFVFGGPLAVAAVLVGVAATVWWVAADVGDARGRSVNLLPIATPVTVLFVIVSIVFFMSRVLLAVPKEASTTIALVVSTLILAVCALVAGAPQIAPSRLVAILATAGVVLVAAGLIAASVGERTMETHADAREVGPTAEVRAKGLAFFQKDLKLPAGQPVILRFKNDAAGIPHNVAIAPDDTFSTELFKGDVVVGPIIIDYQFTAPGPGTYAFHCDVHPNMKGTVTVA
jgi:plastocyanin